VQSGLEIIGRLICLVYGWRNGSRRRMGQWSEGKGRGVRVNMEMRSELGL
jgi:hypothetical protein